MEDVIFHYNSQFVDRSQYGSSLNLHIMEFKIIRLKTSVDSIIEFIQLCEAIQVNQCSIEQVFSQFGYIMGQRRTNQSSEMQWEYQRVGKKRVSGIWVFHSHLQAHYIFQQFSADLLSYVRGLGNKLNAFLSMFISYTIHFSIWSVDFQYYKSQTHLYTHSTYEQDSLNSISDYSNYLSATEKFVNTDHTIIKFDYSRCFVKFQFLFASRTLRNIL
ncbi:Hypothetical_protein [Hexamita inflata]|uniref:Hypothetical_protein n=1 Tax=Hexamita inflata TaxID=28002 RepID=A0AA86QUC0_9EUKA|nr:Hypothetical protein HINF_LOCUS48547 [Hexamita inflata]